MQRGDESDDGNAVDRRDEEIKLLMVARRNGIADEDDREREKRR